MITIYYSKNYVNADGCLWLTPVILASWEAEIRRMQVRSQPQQIVCKTLSQKHPTQKRAGRVVPVVRVPACLSVSTEFKPCTTVHVRVCVHTLSKYFIVLCSPCENVR
jgi:hypothetical protein